MLLYLNIKQEIDVEFDLYLLKLIGNNGVPKKYFYWTIDFFNIIGGLSFQYFDLNDKQKEEINKIGESFFHNPDVYFQVNKNSHRHDLLIRNFNKIFDDKDDNPTKRYEYIKEFVLWKILLELEKGQIVNSGIVKLQRSNFLFTYIKFLVDNRIEPAFKPLAGYTKYIRTIKGEEFVKKLDELDRDYIYDSKNQKEIKRTIHDKNPKLRKKIQSLYVLQDEEPKIYFVFSRNSGGEKEELRELLDIMGKKNTGKLYRGQANSFWNLDASITREPKYLANESDMYYDIQSLKPDAFQNDSSVYERLITMQHFGMPTRLLDITRNPLVAIFFACNNMECKEFDGTIFTFKPENKSDFLNFEDKKLKFLPDLFDENDSESKEESKKFLSKVWFIKGVAKNQRINNQSGDFIFVGNGDNVNEELHKLPKTAIIIDSETKKVLLEQLESLNIHGGAVYPDLTHMSNYIRNKYLKDTSKSEKDILTITTRRVKRTRRGKPKEERDVRTFDFDKIRDKKRDVQISTFSEFYNLDKTGLNKVIEDFLFTEKDPFRDEVAKIMKDNPSIIKERNKIDTIKDKIITLAKIVGPETK